MYFKGLKEYDILKFISDKNNSIQIRYDMGKMFVTILDRVHIKYKLYLIKILHVFNFGELNLNILNIVN